jgi:hypothetical protein
MEPVTLALMLFKAAAAHPAAAASAVGAAARPGVIDVQKMQGSVVDLSKGVLACYHRTAHFEQTDLVQAPFARQAQYGAEQSAVFRITYTGMSTARYQITVAVMAKGEKVRTQVLGDTALVPYSKKCQLEDWTGA